MRPGKVQVLGWSRLRIPLYCWLLASACPVQAMAAQPSAAQGWSTALEQAHGLSAQGEHEKAEPLYRKAIDLARAALGERDTGTATLYRELAENLLAQERAADAEPFARQGLKIAERLPATRKPDIASHRITLARILSAGRKHREAEELYRRALDAVQASASAHDLQTSAGYNGLASSLEAQGKYRDAEEPWRRALSGIRAALGEQDIPTGLAYANLANNLQKQGRYADAEALHRRALDILRNALGESNPITAIGYNNLASDLMGQGKYGEAEPLYRGAMTVIEALLGVQHPNTAAASTNLASSLDAQGKHQDAEPLHRRALEINRATLGERDAAVAASYNNIAANLDAQGRYGEATALYRQALAINLDALGEKHPDTAASYNNLAANLDAQARYGEATALYRQALEIRRAALGERHPDTGTGYNNLAYNLDAQGKYREAEPLHRQALETMRAALGEQHPTLARAYNNLAANLDDQARYRQAEPLYRRALAIRQAALGEQHSDTATSYGNVAASLSAEGRHAEAEPLFQKALDIRRAALGEQHPDTALSYDNLAAALDSQGRYAEAAPLHHRALEIRRKTIGERHADTARSYNNVAFNLARQGRLAEAAPLFAQALDILRATLGDAHPLTAMAYGNVAANLVRQNKPGAARPLFRRSLRILGAALGARHPDLVRTLVDYSMSLSLDGGFDAEAIRTARQAAAIARFRRAHWNGDARTGDQASAAELALARARSLGVQHADPLVYAFDALLLAAWQRAEHAPSEAARLRAEAFTAAQDLHLSAAAQALAQTAVRTAAGSDALAELVRRQQDASAEARRLDRRLIAALAEGSAEQVAQIRAETHAAGQALAALDQRLRTEFPEYAQLVSPAALELGEAQARLREGEGLLLIVPSGEDVFSFALTRTAIAWHRKERGLATVEVSVRELRCQTDEQTCPAGAEALRDKPFSADLAYDLYRDLVAPVESALAGAKRLYAVSSGQLSALPLGMLVTRMPEGALPDDVDAELAMLARMPWLADRYAIISLPAVSALRTARRASAAGAPATPFAGYGAPNLEAAPGMMTRSSGALPVFAGVSASGTPLADPDALRRMAPLPGTEVELRTLADTLRAPQGALRIGDQATEAAIRADPAISSAKVLAFSTHGVLPFRVSGIGEPGLVFTPPATASEADDGLLTASEVSQMSLAADWVILSACNTASSDGTPGADSLSSLARAFIYAGASSLLASHWRVGDEVTAKLIVETLTAYRNAARSGRAEALQQAMHTVRTGKRPDGSSIPDWSPEWGHPAAWAPFSLIAGDDD